MIYTQDKKEISGVYYGSKVITAVYYGGRLVWQLVRSCFGRGYWINKFPWLNDDAWKNNE